MTEGVAHVAVVQRVAVLEHVKLSHRCVRSRGNPWQCLEAVEHVLHSLSGENHSDGAMQWELIEDGRVGTAPLSSVNCQLK